MKLSEEEGSKCISVYRAMQEIGNYNKENPWEIPFTTTSFEDRITVMNKQK